MKLINLIFLAIYAALFNVVNSVGFKKIQSSNF